MDRRTARTAGILMAGAAVGAAGFLAAADDASAGPKELSRKKKAAVVGRAEVPLGLQGLRGAGGNVVVPFTLVDPTRIQTDVEVQYGVDANADGVISDDEYVPATEDRLDSRDTRKNRKPQLWVTAGDIGATHAFVWRSTADVQTARHETLLYRFTDQGRLIPDPNTPGEYLFDSAQAGVRVRIRAVRGKGANRLVGDWAVTDAFSLNNNTPPAMSIDQVLPNEFGAASDENVFIQWTGVDADSEDANNNGQFDPGEDVNGNGVFDQEQLGVAFDYYRLQPGETPSSMTDDELSTLDWKACTRAAGLGDSDSFRETGAGKVYGTPGGRQWTFVWNSIADVGTIRDQFILRARPVDQKKENGAYVYVRTPFTLDNWKVFTSGAAGNAAISLASSRIGCTVTNLVYNLDRSDDAYGKPFQQVIVAGGSTSENSAAVSNVEVFLVNSETADTTSAVAIPFALQTARRFHTATRLADGRVIFAGGVDTAGQPVATTEIYDPKTRTLSAGPTLNAARSRHAAVLLSTDEVAFIGGIGAGNQVLDSIEIYHPTPHGDPVASNSTLTARLGTAMHSASAVLLPSQKVLIAGGIGSSDLAGAAVTSAFVLDPLAGPVDAGVPGAVKSKTPTVSTVSWPTARKFAGFSPMLDGNVLVSGGVSGGTVQSSLEVFHWKPDVGAPDGAFEPVAVTMPDGGRAQHVAALLGDGTVLLAGGATTDPSTGAPQVTGKADVFRIGSFGGATWSGQFLDVNGDMVVARRNAANAVIMNGRPFIAGGSDAAGQATATCEVYTPDNSRNFAPKAYVALPTSDLSHAYGATIYYRLIDEEGDRARIQAQFRAPGTTTWNACSPQDDTIGGDVADDPADLTTTTVDQDNDVLAIDPVARNTPGDHAYIWSMALDIDRPLPGTTIAGYNVRVIPFGAVRGAEDTSDPVTVLYNTKAVTYIVPLEDAIGVTNPLQGGDITLWAHIRDIDGVGTGPRPGDTCSVEFEYAIDANNDGQLTGGETFTFMTPSMKPRNAPVQTNPLPGVTSWSESPFDPSSDITNRPANRGWVAFTWDALYDVGVPSSLLNYQQKNIWVRITARDQDDLGFPKVLRNRPGQPDEFVYVRDNSALWLSSFAPAGGDIARVKVNEPLILDFNGIIDPATVNLNTVKIYRASTQVNGQYKVEPNVPSAGRSRVTFYPQVQNLNAGSPVFSLNDSLTIYFSGNQYRLRLPGYTAKDDPLDDTPPMIRPMGWASALRTFEIVNSGAIDGDADPQYRFSTDVGRYNDQQQVAKTGASPTPGQTIPDLNGSAASSGFSLSYNHAIDVSTVISPNIRVLGSSGSSYVVPGRWSVTNTINADGSSSALVSFAPLFKLPAGDTISVTTAGGFLGTNGLGDTSAQPLVNYVVRSYGRVNTSQTETFASTTNEDRTYVPPTGNTLASWGTDACASGALTGLQDSATQPQTATTALTVAAGATTQLTLSTYDYTSITVQKGGRLVLRSTSGPMVIRTTGNIQIDGIVDFAGAEGATGSHGANSASYSPTLGQTSTTGVRAGGTGYNGGGTGGSSRNNSSDTSSGDNGSSGSGTTSTGGGGGQKPSTSSSGGSTTSYYYYGSGGGAGGGHARAGFAGGHAGNTATFSSATFSYIYTQQGLPSTPGNPGGTSDFSAGISAGGGGGGGGTTAYITSASASVKYYMSGGGGGAGAGAVTFICNGSFTLGPTGYINGQGGQGGGKSHYSGAGGGGAGGGLWIKSGGNVRLDGVIDLRGGRGGPPSFAYMYDTYGLGGASTIGTSRFGGDGSPGRLVVEGPNYLPGLTDEVRVFGSLIVRQITSLPTTSLTYSTPPSAFASTGTGTFVQNLSAATDVAYTSFDIPTGRTVYLQNFSGTTNRAIRIFVRDNTNIQGTLKVNGNGAAFINTSVFPSAQGDYLPLSSNEAQAVVDPVRYLYPASTTTYNTGYTGVVGGGDGGNHAGNTASSHPNQWEAYDGKGPAPGTHKIKTGGGGYSGYYTGDAGGGGAGNATPGREGWAPYGVPYAYNYNGAVLDTTGSGVPATTRVLDGGQAGAILDSSLISTSTIANFPGSGGGGGNPGGWPSQRYMGIAGTGGAGGGAVAIICQGTINLQTGAQLDFRGGDGNPPGDAYPYYYSQAAGGGGSGGTFYIAGTNVNIAATTIGEGASANGVTVDLRGGYGGGWRTPRSGLQNRYPWYNSHGNFGGDGGFGRMVVEYRTSLNSGRALANRWGYEQSVFTDGSNQYRSLAGTATFKCRGLPGGSYFRSKFVDLGSLRPRVTSLSAGSILNAASFTLQGQGAQSHPHNPGTGGTGEADGSNLGTLTTASTAMSYDGWRWWRFQGSFTRFSTGAPPVIDNIASVYTTDGTP